MDAFERAVDEYLKPYEGQFHHATMRQDHLDPSRFVGWAGEAGAYRPIAGSVVLCSGCGSGGDLLAFMEAGAAGAHGIEVSTGLADLARQRFRGTRHEPAVKIASYDGSRLPYEDRSFDIVFSMHVVEHTSDPVAYLTDLFRVLRPGGIIFLDVPNRYFWMEQHIHWPYIHFLPLPQRDRLIRGVLSSPLAPYLPARAAYKLTNYQGIHFPSPALLVATFRANQERYGLKLEEAFYHSGPQQRVPYRSGWAGWRERLPEAPSYVIGSQRKMRTFRLVVRRS